MKLKESLTTDEQEFISKLIDELDVYDFIDWDKSEDSIYLFPEKLEGFHKKYREEIPEKYFNVLSRCLHPETWEKLSGLRVCFWVYATGELTIPDGVRAIPPNAFSGCSELTSIKIPSSATYIGSQAFHHCNYLSSVTIPDSVTSIGDYAFAYCISLSSVTIPSSVTSIGNYAFYHCHSLSSVPLPSSVTSIGDYAFNNCPELVIETKDRRIANRLKKMGVNVKLIESLQLTETRRQTAVKSNGVYSVLRDEWIKEPVAEDIPEINEEEFEKLFKEWEDKYFALLDEVK